MTISRVLSVLLAIFFSQNILASQTSYVLDVVSATYGANATPVYVATCPAVTQNNRLTQVQQACANNNGYCSYTVVITPSLPDPAKYCRKDLVVQFRCQGGELHTQKLSPEAFGKTVNMSCYSPPSITSFSLKLESSKAYLKISGQNFDGIAASNTVLFTPVLSAQQKNTCFPVEWIDPTGCPAPIEQAATTVTIRGGGALETLTVEVPLNAGTGPIAIKSRGVTSLASGAKLSVVTNTASCNAAGLSGIVSPSEYCAFNNNLNRIRHLVLSGQNDYTLTSQTPTSSFQLPDIVIVPNGTNTATLGLRGATMQAHATIQNASKLYFMGNLTATDRIVNEGELTINPGFTLSTNFAIVNSGQITIHGTLQNGNTLTNSPTGAISIQQGGSFFTSICMR